MADFHSLLIYSGHAVRGHSSVHFRRALDLVDAGEVTSDIRSCRSLWHRRFDDDRERHRNDQRRHRNSRGKLDYQQSSGNDKLNDCYNECQSSTDYNISKECRVQCLERND